MGFKNLFKKKEVADDNINVTEEKEEQKVVEEKEQEKAEQNVPQENASEQSKTQQDVPAKMISAKRRQEIGQLVFKNEIEESDLASLSIQETIFVLVNVDHFNEESNEGVKNYQQKCEMLDKVLAKKLAEAEVLYLTFDAGTSFPYITQGCVEIYSELEYAQDAVRHYGEQYRAVNICEVRKNDSRFPNKMSIFEFLYYLGMEHILVDNGRYKTVVNREDILAITDKNPEYAVDKPIQNPNFRYRLIEFFQEVKWPVTYENREQVVEQKEAKMLEELKKAKFLVPMLFDGEEIKGEQNQFEPQEGKNMILPKLETQEHVCFTPLFTDWTEFVKIYPKDKWNGLVISFDEAVTLCQDMGIVINPAGENLIMNQQSFEALRNREENQEK